MISLDIAMDWGVRGVGADIQYRSEGGDEGGDERHGVDGWRADGGRGIELTSREVQAGVSLATFPL